MKFATAINHRDKLLRHWTSDPGCFIISNMSMLRILMPCYNTQPEFLLESVDSVIHQEFSDWELVVVDDGSSRESTRRVLEEISVMDDRIVVIRQDNAGPAAARNTAAKYRSPDGRDPMYILPFDSDDLLSPDYATKAIGYLESHPEVRIVTSKIRFIGRVPGYVSDASGVAVYPPFDLTRPFEATSVPNPSFFRMVDYMAIGGYAEEMRDGAEDSEFFLRLMSTLGGEVATLDIVGFDYRITGNSRTDDVLSDPEKHLRSLGQLVLRNAGYFARFPEKVFHEQMMHRNRLAKFENRYGKVERIIDILRMRKFFPRI